MNRILRFRFSIATILWLTFGVAAFCTWWMLLRREIEFEHAYISTMAQNPASVSEVVDGDTIVYRRYDSRKIHASLVGVDCPELNQPFGNAARQITTEFCNTTFTIEPIGDKKDRDDSRLADLLVDGKSLRETLLIAGLAWHDKRNNSDPKLAKLENEARAAMRGLWSDPDAVAPWDWRK